MHHEPDMSAEMSKRLAEQIENMRLGPTGRFPGGKLTSNDEGEIAFGVSTLKGKVVVAFGKPIASLGMSAKEARLLANSLRKNADIIDPKSRRKK